jgi:hypothetical protein
MTTQLSKMLAFRFLLLILKSKYYENFNFNYSEQKYIGKY